MKTQHDLFTRLTLTTASLALALASMIVLAPAANADVLSDYKPQGLIQAERAIEQGKSERALKILHRQRAILSHDKYLAERQALSCQAYFQQQDYTNAERACGAAVALRATQDVKSVELAEVSMN
jgi:hypothetical protein